MYRISLNYWLTNTSGSFGTSAGFAFVRELTVKYDVL